MKKLILFISFLMLSLTSTKIFCPAISISSYGRANGIAVLKIDAESGGFVTVKNISPITLWLWGQADDGEWAEDKYGGYKLDPGATVEIKVNSTPWDISAWVDQYGTRQVSVEGRLEVLANDWCVCGSCYGSSHLGTAGGCL